MFVGLYLSNWERYGDPIWTKRKYNPSAIIWLPFWPRPLIISGFHDNLGCETRVIREMSPCHREWGITQAWHAHTHLACHTPAVSMATYWYTSTGCYLCTIMGTQSARKEFQYVCVCVCVCVCVYIYVLCTHALWGFQPKNYLISGLLVSCNGVQVVVGAAANAFTLLAPKLLHLQGFAGWLKGPYYCRLHWPCKFKAESAVHLVSF